MGGKVKLTFERILQMAEVKYIIKKEKYKESWKNMPILVLRERLRDEYFEWREESNTKDEFNELIDIINVACMLAERIRPESKRGKA